MLFVVSCIFCTMGLLASFSFRALTAPNCSMCFAEADSRSSILGSGRSPPLSMPCCAISTQLENSGQVCFPDDTSSSS
ncbi:hypothetical protein Mapa_002095 [Marchantia paleacea]|nr:hypothetical protein Mapa_002095 [Marchantia paleacea]